MAFGDFQFPQVLGILGLTHREVDLFGPVAPIAPRPEFAERVADGVMLALAINTEKARSEFIIAPVLLELRRMLDRSFGLFSGVDFTVDPARGLDGVCDFIITRPPLQYVLTSPLMTIVEAKNDNVRNGLGQCIASMVAAAQFNARSGGDPGRTYGVVTTGSAWKFLVLEGRTLTFDVVEHQIGNLGAILAILRACIDDAAGPRAITPPPTGP